MSRSLSKLHLTAAALAVTTLLAACGSSAATTSNSPHQLTQAQLRTLQQDAVRFAHCLRSHGVPNFPDPSSPADFKQSMRGLNSPADQSAIQSCQHLLPGGGQPSGGEAPTPAELSAELAFARCIRSHGIPNFPDPASHAGLSHQVIAGAGIDIHQPAVIQAADACVGVTHGLLTRADVARFVAGH